MLPVIPSRPPSTTVPASSMYCSRSVEWPDGQTSSVASIVPSAMPGNWAFSLTSWSSTVHPICSSIRTLATFAFASAPTHGFTASVIGSLPHCATFAAVVPPPPRLRARDVAAGRERQGHRRRRRRRPSMSGSSSVHLSPFIVVLAVRCRLGIARHDRLEPGPAHEAEGPDGASLHPGRATPSPELYGRGRWRGAGCSRRPPPRARSAPLPSANTTSCPSPAAPISPAMITTDRTIMIVWFTPSRIVGLASGSCTFRSSCIDVDPYASPASTISLGTCRMPEVREPDPHRQRVDERRDDRRHAPRLDEQQHRDQVDEGGQRLHGVEDRPRGAFEPVALRAEDPERDRHRDRDDHRDEHERERRHGEVPHPEHADGQETQEHAGREPPSGEARTRSPRRAPR